MKKKKAKERVWFHVTTMNCGQFSCFHPSVPGKLRLKGEDRVTPRVSVSWSPRAPIHMMCLIRPQLRYYIYATKESPKDPRVLRKEALESKFVRKNSTKFVCPDAEASGIERWFMQPIEMELVGCIEIHDNDLYGSMMTLGLYGYKIDFDRARFIPFKNRKFQEGKRTTVKAMMKLYGAVAPEEEAA